MEDMIRALTLQFQGYANYGYSIFSVNLRDEALDGDFYIGTYRRYGLEHECRFLKLAPHLTRQCDEILILSNKVNSSLLIPPLLASTFDGKYILLGYEFDSLFINFSVPIAFVKVNGILCLFWRQETSNLLLLIEKMHSVYVFHGHLDKDESYVIRDNHIHIITRYPLVDGTKLDPTQIKAAKKKDLLGFLDFLVKHIRGLSSCDWNLFQELVLNQPMDDITIFLNHPVLKNSSQRLNYYRQAHDCIGFHRSPLHTFEINEYWTRMHLTYSKELNGWISSSNEGWRSRLQQGTLLYRLFKATPKDVVPYEDKLDDILRFILDSFKHLKNTEDTNVAKTFEREVENMFPGFLGYIHNISADSFYSVLTVAREYTEASKLG